MSALELDFDGASMPELLEWMDHASPPIRADAACAVGDRLRTREIATVEPAVHDRLAALLDDPVLAVRLDAAIALAELRDSRAMDVLIEASRWRHFRLDAIRALGTLGDTNAVPMLRGVLQRLLMPWADKLQAAAALCALGDVEGQDYLRSRLASRRTIERAAALHFIGESRHPEAREILEPILNDADHPQRDVAARALGLLGDVNALPALERARADTTDEALREDISRALDLLRE